MGTTKKDLLKCPTFVYKNGHLVRIYGATVSNNLFQYQWHHYIRQSWIKQNPEKFKEIEHLQKLFLLPTQMHQELHSHHSKFYERYGVRIEELLYDGKI